MPQVLFPAHGEKGSFFKSRVPLVAAAWDAERRAGRTPVVAGVTGKTGPAPEGQPVGPGQKGSFFESRVPLAAAAWDAERQAKRDAKRAATGAGTAPSTGAASRQIVNGKDRDAEGKWDPNATLWQVTGDPDDVESVGLRQIDVKDINPKNATIWANGMANNALNAAELGLHHTGQKQFYMIHNPSNGGLSDLGESAVQKLGIPTKVAKSTRDLLRQFDLPTANVVAHSQGTLIANDALQDLRKEGKDMRGMKLNYHGAAANVLRSKMLAKGIGADVQEYKGHALDAVHNVVGMNTVNPLRLAGSLAAAPPAVQQGPGQEPALETRGTGEKAEPGVSRAAVPPAASGGLTKPPETKGRR